MEYHLSAITSSSFDNIRAITWDIVKLETAKDQTLQDLIQVIKSGFPERKNMLQPHIHQFWDQRQNFYIIDDVIMMLDCVLVPECLRRKVIESLHAAHQGETTMGNRAKESVYWPGITRAIELRVTTAIVSRPPNPDF